MTPHPPHARLWASWGLRALALAAIRTYQRWVSPHKGFACAWRVHTGRASCSQLAARAVRRYGVWGGWVLLRQRLHLCGVAYRRHQPHPAPQPAPQSAPTVRQRPPAAQRGDCDLPCVDLPEIDCTPGRGLDCLDACQVCDCGSGSASKDNQRKDRKGRTDAQVPLPGRH